MIELLVSTLIERIADFLHQLIIEIEVMQNGEPHTEHFLSLKQMTNIGSRIVPAGGTSALLGDRSGIICVFLVKNIDLATPCK